MADRSWHLHICNAEISVGWYLIFKPKKKFNRTFYTFTGIIHDVKVLVNVKGIWNLKRLSHEIDLAFDVMYG